MNLLTNTSSLLAQRNASAAHLALSQAITRLSSGLRINGAADDAAGLAIANRMTSQIRGGAQAARNAQDAMSMLEVAQGSLDEVNAALQRVRQLVVQGVSGTMSDSDRDAIQLEITERMKQIGQLAQGANLNGINLFNQAHTASMQVGQGSSATDVLSIDFPKIDTFELGLEDLLAPFRIKPGGGNPVPLGPPMKTMTVDRGSGPEEYTPIINDIIGDEIQHPKEEWEEYLGIKAEDVTFHRIIDPLTGNYLPDLFVVKFGDFYGRMADHQVITDSGYVNFDDDAKTMAIWISSNHQETFLDPDNGITTPIQIRDPWQFSSVFVTPEGELKYGYLYDGKAYPNANFVASGPTANFMDVMLEYPATINPLGKIDEAIAKIDGYRSYFGAMQNRLDSVASNLSTTELNLSAARSRIQDADYVAEVSAMTREQIISQAAQSMLAQANQVSSGVLALLR